LTLVICLSSCSTIKLKNRIGKDVHLDYNSSEKLSGNYKNYNDDAIALHSYLSNNFKNNSINKQKELSVNVTPINKNKLGVTFSEDKIIIDSLTLKGKYKKGYFKVKRKWDTHFIAGPLLWILNDNLCYLGLTNENKLVVIKSSGGVMLLVAFPIFSMNGVQSEIEFELHE